MDTIPHRDFIKLFDRISTYVDMKDCNTPEDIERRMRRCLQLMQNGVDGAKKESTKRKLLGRMKMMWTIIREGTKPTTALTTQRKYDLGLPNRRVSFATTIIDEAIELSLIHI